MTASISQALDLIMQSPVSAIQTKKIDILSSVGCICAKDMYVSIDLPRFDHSAMDGYGIRLKDAGRAILVQESIYAGAKSVPTLKDGYAIRIMTGAPMPIGCEVVVPLEDIIYEDNKELRLPNNLTLGKNIRKKGEELPIGARYLKKGEEITPYMVGLLASQGVSSIDVFSKPKVTILSTGDELVSYLEENIKEYEIYDSNTPMFAAKITALGCDAEVVQIHTDEFDVIKSGFKKVFQNANFVISTGGASVGDRDMTQKVFKDLGGKIIFDKVDIKPGKPTSFGLLNETPFLILPGNPLAAMVNFELFGTTLIDKLRGKNDYIHCHIHAKMGSDYKIKKGKNSAILGYFDGANFKPISNQSPNQVSSLHNANSMLITNPNVEFIGAGDMIDIILLNKK